MPKPRPTTFDQPIAERVRAATRLVEQTFKGRVAPVAPAWPSWNPGCQPAVVTTAIPAGSPDAPSTAGRATLYRVDSDGSFTEDDDQTDQEIRNYHNAGAAVGKTVTIYYMSGFWWLVAIDC